MTEVKISRLTASEAVRFYINELQGRKVNLRKVLESGVEVDHGHCPDTLGVGMEQNRIIYDSIEYQEYFRKLGIEGSVEVDLSSLLLVDEVTVYREGNLWPVNSVLKAFKWTDFPGLFAARGYYGYDYGRPINGSREAIRSNVCTLDMQLGEGVPRTEAEIERIEERIGGLDRLVVTEHGYKFLTAALAARV